MTSEEFARRLLQQVDVGQSMLFEFLGCGYWNAVDLRKWLTGTTALLEKEFTPSSPTLHTFIWESSKRDIEYQLSWVETLEKCLQILHGIQQALVGDQGH